MRVKFFLASVRADLVDMAAVVNRREQPLEQSVPLSAAQFSLHRTSWTWIFCLAVQRMYGPLRHLSNLGVSEKVIELTMSTEMSHLCSLVLRRFLGMLDKKLIRLPFAYKHQCRQKMSIAWRNRAAAG